MIPPSTPGAGDREGGEPSASLRGATRRGSYYNEFDPFAARWLRNLISAGHIAQGVVDDRPIQQVQPGDIPERAHFFAGIGGWDLALQLAGWPAEWPVWTGSCPCQPFSAAGKRKGVEDERHLWPEFLRLIAECRPPVVFGEQVASSDGRLWLAGVRSDLEALGYAVGASDLCSAGVGAPNIRQRLYWVAVSTGAGSLPGAYPGIHSGEESAGPWDGQPQRRGATGRLGSAGSRGRQDAPVPGELRASPAGVRGQGNPQANGATGSGPFDRLEFPQGDGREQRWPESSGWSPAGGRGLGYWDAFDILPCLDGKARRVEPGSFPLAHGVPGRVGLLRGYGNAIVPQVAAEFIRAFLEAEGLPEASSPKGPLPATPEVTP